MGEVRDYIDVDGIMRSGRYTMLQLLDLAVEHDPGFHAGMFVEALLAVQRLPQAAFEPYGLSAEEADALITRTIDYAHHVNSAVSG